MEALVSRGSEVRAGAGCGGEKHGLAPRSQLCHQGATQPWENHLPILNLLDKMRVRAGSLVAEDVWSRQHSAGRQLVLRSISHCYYGLLLV